MSPKPYSITTFFYEALEPVHVGAGGYRLGRVDNTICREPGTNVPKIPGTSLAGAARAYASLIYGKPEAGGQHRNYKGEKQKCPIIQTFGTATDQGGGTAGRVSFGDAQILFFPVATMNGRAWVSTPELVNKWAGGNAGEIASKEKILVPAAFAKSRLNLGWVLLSDLTELSIKLDLPKDLAKFKLEGNLVLVHESLFPQIVNSNLEVRTSVSIDPATGAAEGGALFTYEAIPRATIFVQQVVEDQHGKPFQPPVRRR